MITAAGSVIQFLGSVATIVLFTASFGIIIIPQLIDMWGYKSFCKSVVAVYVVLWSILHFCLSLISVLVYLKFSIPTLRRKTEIDWLETDCRLLRLCIPFTN
jgi:Ca2+/H+ antiporter